MVSQLPSAKISNLDKVPPSLHLPKLWPFQTQADAERTLNSPELKAKLTNELMTLRPTGPCYYQDVCRTVSNIFAMTSYLLGVFFNTIKAILQ